MSQMRVKQHVALVVLTTSYIYVEPVEDCHGSADQGNEIDALVARYCAMTGQINKSEAARQALSAQIRALSKAEALADRVMKLQSRAATEGFSPAGDDKAFMDDMWGET